MATIVFLKVDLADKDRIKLELEKDQLKKQEAEWVAKEQELADKERLEPWNVDTIGHEAFSKSVCNDARVSFTMHL